MEILEKEEEIDLDCKTDLFTYLFKVGGKKSKSKTRNFKKRKNTRKKRFSKLK